VDASPESGQADLVAHLDRAVRNLGIPRRRLGDLTRAYAAIGRSDKDAYEAIAVAGTADSPESFAR
jgi:hypothetical protein